MVQNVIPDEESISWREVMMICSGFIGIVVSAGVALILLRGVVF